MTLWLLENVIECVFAIEGHTILKIWLILRIKKFLKTHSITFSNNHKVINKNKMSCNTLCPCISSVWEQYSKILHNMQLILRIKFFLSCSSLLTSNIEYGDIMIGFFSILQIVPGKF
jgi:hypothetical protein